MLTSQKYFRQKRLKQSTVKRRTLAKAKKSTSKLGLSSILTVYITNKLIIYLMFWSRKKFKCLKTQWRLETGYVANNIPYSRYLPFCHVL